ncbi:MAG TPA: cytosine permease [Actinomycetota bacterium]|nr:cytosine permease [Actinomycetota bacterium]
MASVTERLGRAVEREAPAWGVRPTPPEVRRLSGIDFAVLWGDLGIGLLVLVTGALLVPALGLPRALLAIVIGSVIGCIPLALVGRAGAREGVPGMVLLRPALGTRGSYLPSILNVVQLIGWTAFELWAMALVASRVSGPILGTDGFVVWLIVAAVVCLVLSLGGPVVVVRRWMARFGVWIVAAVAAYLSIRVAFAADLGVLWAKPGAGGFPTFWPAVDLVIAMPASWIPLVADYSRFARRGVSSAGGTYLGYLVANVWFYSLGALLVLSARAPVPSVAGIADGIVAVAGGAILLIVLLVGETDEAFADIYSAAVSAQNLASGIRQRTGVVAVTALGVAGAAWLSTLPDQGVLTYELFLLLIGSVFVPLFGVFLADYHVLRRNGGYRSGVALFDERGPYRYTGGVHLAAIGAWLLGVAAYHWTAPTAIPGWSSAVETLFAGWLGLPFPLLGGAVPASALAFATGFASYLVLTAVGRAVSRSPSGRPEVGPPS